MIGSTGADILVSADSHVMESPTLWVDRLPGSLTQLAPRFPGAHKFDGRPGGRDPTKRVDDMAVDGVSAEVLYPTLAMPLFGGLADSGLQERCFATYNDWLTEYCSHSPARLLGVSLISMYDIDHAVQELERTRRAGLRGTMIWQAPPETLPFHSRHYDRFWAAAEALETPVSLHILTGFDWSQRTAREAMTGVTTSEDELKRLGEFAYRGMVNDKLTSAMNALNDLIMSGVFQRFPKLKIVFVENEIGWIPFALDQMDKYYLRNPKAGVPKPSEQFENNFYATFFNDNPGARSLAWWGEKQCMWSNDFPHQNSTWPESRQVVERMLGKLEPGRRRRLTYENVCDLYRIDIEEVVSAST